jgi:peptidoglycan/xylan/chitin deacetylase (PgdA/CDA1 family)
VSRAAAAGARRLYALLPDAAREPLRRLVGFAIERSARWSRRRAGLALVYHRVGEPAGDRQRELVPALATTLFEAELGHLRRRYRVVRASELPAAVAARRRGDRFPVAITFDDDLASHVEVATPALRRVGVPATFFVCGASIERPWTFWWEALQIVCDRRLAEPAHVPDVDPADFRAALAREPGALGRVARSIESLPPERLEALRAQLVDRLAPDLRPKPFGAGGVSTLAGQGFDVGFHTRRHLLLTGVDEPRLEAALLDGRADVELAAGRPVTLLAYPHGKADDRVAAAAERAGYELAFTGRREPVGPHTPPWLIGRIEPKADSPGRFALEVARALRQPERRRAAM